ncbi:diguanylate cyclase [Psychrosphaera saromensis]|uniref:Histidine kinase n=1 Tax=Psychrosphaera saromensis TaxID=716813 RepID=A0A2S7UY76_9GAMM|nr:HDOD domain-containing protein [Psychrosphaera saromensis]PQJ54442.1 histidine kinase [Psychrosphaera saromensis]GHB59908.1 diguanylate cyclase [Psychrosphaera saromensis]GLQ14362.1 diguanylate cyclase [Psychrosphaera saromensis]
MNAYTARQAIYNRKENVVAYELLFRDSLTNVFPKIESNSATSKLLLDSHFNQGLEKITSGKPALINYPEQALLDLMPTLLPPTKAMVEILESVRPTAAVYEACRQLFHKGYRLVLDDFIYSEDWVPFFKLVRLIKFDLQQSTFAEIEVVLEKIRPFKNLKFLAERVETQEQYDKAKEMGFDFFQGYYFCTPQIVEQKDINSNQSVVFAMYQETLKLDADYTKLSSFFERDTALAYKLLKFINSGLFPVRKQISSLKQALIYLGAAQVKKFVTLILTAHIAENRRQELTEMSIIRARFCEQIATNAAPQLSDKAFILGLFSLLDVILDQTMEDLVKELPVTEDIASALIGDDNILGNIFILAKAYEAANWELMGEICVKLNIEQDLLPEYYVNAVGWAKIYEESNDSKI